MKRVVLALAVACAHFAFAETYTWSGGGESGKWSDPANWQGGGYPGSGDVAIFGCDAEITEGIAIAAGTLTITNSAGTALHLKGVISGEGGIFKGGDGSLHLHAENTFKGGFISCGTGEYNEDTSGTPSSCVYVYADDALGTGLAQFDPVSEVGTTAGHGALLYVSGAQQKSITLSCPVTLTGNYANKTVNITVKDGCTALVFKETVSCPGRITFRSSAGFTGTFEKGYSCGGYNIFEGGVFHFYGAVNGTVHAYDSVTTHLYSQDNSYGYYCIGGGLGLHCENALRPSGSYFGFPTAKTVVNLNGYDQNLSGMVKAFSQPKGDVCTFGFTSPDDKPAMLRLKDAVPAHPDFRGLFSGAAGLEWAPSDAAREFCFSNTLQTTRGEFMVSGGVMRFRNGAGFDRLAKLSVKKGAKFATESTAGILSVGELTVEEGGVLELAAGVVLQCSSLTVGGEKCERFGSYGASELPGVVAGGGVVRLTPQINIWKGDAGNWSDGGNWSLGRAPAENEGVSVPDSATVVLDRPTPRLFSFSMNGGATLVFSNGWDTCLWADDIDIANSTVTIAGPFTNEADKCRAYFKCVNFTLGASARIDADGKGWRGGGYEQTAGVNNPGTHIFNSSGVKSGGFGPGGANTAMGASHFGYGAPVFMQERVYHHRISRLYDDPRAPSEPGSGGFGLGASAYGCVFDALSIPSGGGAVFIDASGAVSVDGTVSACGVGSYINHYYYCQHPKYASTGGSGGSVRIKCETIAGGGTIMADGGNGGFSIPGWVFGVKNITSSGAPGGGGGIAVEYNEEKQAAGAVAGMKISAAAGYYPEMPKTSASDRKTEPLAYAKMDKYRHDAEPGTLYFTDRKIIDDTIGKGLNGKLFSVEAYVYDGDLDWGYGNVRFGATGAVFTVNGDLTVTGEWSRIDIGGITRITNFGTRPYIHSGTVPVGLTVNGDLVISNGAALAVYAARVDNETSPGARVNVAGAFIVGDGGTVLPTSDYGHGGAPAFTAGSFTLAEGGKIDADHRGCSGAWNSADYSVVNGAQGQVVKGCGPGAGKNSGAGAGYGGTGGEGQWKGASTGSGNGGVYGDPYRPVRSGSGGGSGGYTWAGDGGGVFCLEAAGSVKLAGIVTANGSFHEYMVYDTYHYAGCGSGGSVLISGATVESSETALISARGGDAPMMSSPTISAGCGGGGRVAIWTGRDVELKSDKPKVFHLQDPASEKFGGTLVWNGAVDVGGGTNIMLRTDAGAPQPGQLPASHGGAGTVWFNRSAPQGLSVIVR
jgi:hypothetical protein